MFKPSASRIAKIGNRAPVVKGAGRMKFGGPTVESFQAPFAKRIRKASPPLRLPARNAGHWLHSNGFCSYCVGPACIICLGKFFSLYTFKFVVGLFGDSKLVQAAVPNKFWQAFVKTRSCLRTSSFVLYEGGSA